MSKYYVIKDEGRGGVRQNITPPPPQDLTSEGAKSGRAELLNSLNQGENVTSGLRKVTDEEKTHKNPELRSNGLVKADSKAESQPGTGAATKTQSSKPAKTELEGKRWNVEYHKNNREIIIEDVELQHSVYVYKCEGCTIQVKGKCSNIVLDQCKKTGLVFDSVMVGMEMVNCQSVQVQVTGSTPTISVEKTDGCQMFISQESLGVNIISSKSSEMNVMVSNGEDFVELAVPEQFKTTIIGTALKTVPTDHSVYDIYD